jgi:hypothetical protein
MTSRGTAFDGNDYRKRVLAAIEARGGVQTSDPFEYYDLPLADVRDAAVAAQVDAVWAFWQKQRDSRSTAAWSPRCWTPTGRWAR